MQSDLLASLANAIGGLTDEVRALRAELRSFNAGAGTPTSYQYHRPPGGGGGAAGGPAVFEDQHARRPAHHTYPSSYPKGKYWSLDAAWEMLDMIKPEDIPDDVRMYLAGMIGSRLMRERARGN